MNKEQIIKLIDIFEKEMAGKSSFQKDNYLAFRFKDILEHIPQFLPDHKNYFRRVTSDLDSTYTWQTQAIKEIIKYIRQLFEINFELAELKKRSILQGAKDKLKEAGISFEREDYTSVINNLNTSVELALKDELDIPTTISKINTRKLLEICISEKLGPVDYLKELVKHVLEIDNKIKHQGFNPKKVDCINAIAAVEGFLKKSHKYPFKVNETVRNKIFTGI